MRRALVDNLTARDAVHTIVPRKVDSQTIQTLYTLDDLRYDVNSTMLDVVLPVVTPVANKVISDWTSPTPLPEPTDAKFESDGTSCTDNEWFDEDAVHEITYRADVGPLLGKGGWNVVVEFDDETEHYSIEPDLSPHIPTPACSSVQGGACGHSTCERMPDTPISICSQGQLEQIGQIL
jgi:hypothetical protein